MQQKLKSLKDLLLEYFDFVVKLSSDIIDCDRIESTDIQYVLNEHILLVKRINGVTSLPKEFKERLAGVHLSSKIHVIPKSLHELRENSRYVWLNLSSREDRLLGNEQCYRDRLVAYRNQMSHFRFAVANMKLP